MYMGGTHVMFTLFCHVLVNLKDLFLKDLKLLHLGAYRRQGGRLYYRDNLIV
jgi:hypothetical protein